MISLAYEVRDAKINPVALRRKGIVPAVFYGRKQKSVSVTVSEKAFAKAFAKVGENAVLTLQGPAGAVPALVHEVARHPVSGAVEHIDFYAFEAGQKLAVQVPLEFVGVSLAVKEKGAILVKVLRELSIEAEPAKLPHSIAVDVSPLVDFHSQILAKDIALPEGVALREKPEEVVASVYEPKEEKVEEAPPPDLSQIEVVKSRRSDEESEVGIPTEASGKGTEKKEEKKEGKKEEKKK